MKKKLNILFPNKLFQKERLLFLFKDTIIYGGAAAISRAFSLITFPILARHFSVSDYGQLDFLLVISGFLSTLLIFGQDSAVARYFYEYKSIKSRKSLITQSLIFQMSICILIVPILYIFSTKISAIIFNYKNAHIYFQLILLQIPFMILINFSQNILKWTFQRSFFLFMSVGFVIVQATFIVIGTTTSDLNIKAVLVLYLSSNIIFGILGLILIKDWLTSNFKNNYLKKLIPFAIPIGIICVFDSFIPALERNIIILTLDPEKLGLFSSGAKVAMLISIIVSAFQMAWEPFCTSLHKEKNASITFNFVLITFCFLLCCLLLSIDLISKPILIFLASYKYLNASDLIFPIAMAICIKAISGITEVGISFSKKSYLYLYSHILFIISLLIFLSFLIPKQGLLGVAISLLLAEIVRSLVSSFLAQRVFYLPWTYKPVLLMLTIILITVTFTKLFLNVENIELKILIYSLTFLFLIIYYFILAKDVLIANNFFNIK